MQKSGSVKVSSYPLWQEPLKVLVIKFLKYSHYNPVSCHYKCSRTSHTNDLILCFVKKSYVQFFSFSSLWWHNPQFQYEIHFKAVFWPLNSDSLFQKFYCTEDPVLTVKLYYYTILERFLSNNFLLHTFYSLLFHLYLYSKILTKPIHLH